MNDRRRLLPSVDALLQLEAMGELIGRFGRDRVVRHIRAEMDAVRQALGRGEDRGDVADAGWWPQRVASALEAADVPSLRPVVNATGVVLHTNLGRAPLAAVARDAMVRVAAGYSNLEFDLEEGTRGSRYDHCASLLASLSGAEAALVVNNAAGALVLALNTVAAGRGVPVSRGELVEIGGGFRIPEIMERSGARLVEVGATNRTRPADFRKAVEGGGVAALLKVHRSNFRMTGFTEEAGLEDLVGLGRERGLPVLHDLGSGLFVDPALLGLPAEPRAAESVAAGADLVVVSGDKLFGGPQAGIVVGRGDLIAALRANPLCRALRVDKVTLAALEATARLYLDPPRALREIPTLRMLAEPQESVRARAGALVDLVAGRVRGSGEGSTPVTAELVASEATVGGGTFPGVGIPSWALALRGGPGPDALAARLRSGDPAVVGRIEEGRFLLDARTVAPAEMEALVGALARAIGATS